MKNIATTVLSVNSGSCINFINNAGKWREKLLADLKLNGPRRLNELDRGVYSFSEVVSMIEYLETLGNVRIEVRNKKGNLAKNPSRYELDSLPKGYKAVIFYGEERESL